MGTTSITCPGCGTVSHFDNVRRSSDEFCRRCDYPLFWVRSADAPPADPSLGDVGLRRLPGAGGHQAAVSLGCPHCNEPNAHTATVCIRCGGDLRPAPPPPPVFVPAPPPPPEPAPPPPPPEPIPPMWPQLLLVVGLPTLILLVLLAIVG